jgi:hypothetical protein
VKVTGIEPREQRGLTKQIHTDSQKQRRSYLAMQLLSAGDLRRLKSASRTETFDKLFMTSVGASVYTTNAIESVHRQFIKLTKKKVLSLIKTVS